MTDRTGLREQLAQISELHSLRPDQLDNLAQILEDAGAEGILYPSIMKRKMKISLTRASELLKILNSEQILEGSQVILCPNCHRISTIHSRSLSDFVQLKSCLYCRKSVVLPRDTFMLYRRKR